MKSMIINFGFFMMMILSSMIIVAVSKKQAISEEATEALSVSIRNSMELWQEYPAISKTDIINNFVKVFESGISSKSKYNIYFYEIDTVEGLIDVEVEAVFKFPNLKSGKINIRKTMICDEKIN